MRSVDGAIQSTSKRSGNEVGAAGARHRRRAPDRSPGSLPDASTRRDHTELLTVTVPLRTGASNGPRSDRSASTTERNPSG